MQTAQPDTPRPDRRDRATRWAAQGALAKAGPNAPRSPLSGADHSAARPSAVTATRACSTKGACSSGTSTRRARVCTALARAYSKHSLGSAHISHLPAQPLLPTLTGLRPLAHFTAQPHCTRTVHASRHAHTSAAREAALLHARCSRTHNPPPPSHSPAHRSVSSVRIATDERRRGLDGGIHAAPRPGVGVWRRLLGTSAGVGTSAQVRRLVLGPGWAEARA